MPLEINPKSYNSDTILPDLALLHLRALLISAKVGEKLCFSIYFVINLSVLSLGSLK
jgi:hypothetical protein